LGELLRVDAQGLPHTLLIVERFVRNQGDAWGWSLDLLRRAIASVAVTDANEDAREEALGPYLPLAAAIGQRLAELHAVLAEPADDPAFAPEPVGREDAQAWARAAVGELSAACRALAGFTGWESEAQHAQAEKLVSLRAQIATRLEELAQAGVGALRTRIHGDFHLGQVLVTSGDAMLIDFEGEPAKPLAERRAKACPLRDVAGLLRSFDYAAATLAREPAPSSELSAERRDEFLRRFIEAASTSFLGAYHATARTAAHRWYESDEAADALTDLFLVQKAAYEITYEVANRPGWVGIPLRGLLDLAERLLMRETADA
jgi:maltose alpha-D-glucosyltransferase/alpha-amylase